MQYEPLIYNSHNKNMYRKLIVSIQYVFFFVLASAQSLDDLSENLLKKSNLPDTVFEQTITKINFQDLKPNDTIRQYRQWLKDNRQTLLLKRSDNFKTHYFLELAQYNATLNDLKMAYRNIDSALFYVNPLKFPHAYYHILNFGTSISETNLDGTTTIRFLKQIIDSKTVEQDSVTKGETLLRLAGTLESMHRYLESSKYCQQALDIYRELGDNAKMIKLLIIMFENASHTTDDDSKWEYLYQAYEIASQSGDSALLADVYTSFGLAYYRKGNQAEAIRYYKMARSMISDAGSEKELLITTYQHLSYALLDSVDLASELSKYLMEQSIKNNSTQLSNAYGSRAWYFARKDLIDSATYYLEKSTRLRESQEKDEASPIYYYYMYEVALIIHNYDLALKYLHKSLMQFKKYNREVNSNQLTAIRAQFDYDLQKERIKKLRFEKEYEHEKVRRHRVATIAIVAVLITAFVFLFLLRRQLKKLNAAFIMVVKKNLELDKVNVSLKRLEKKKVNNSVGINSKAEKQIYIQLKNLLEEDKIFRKNDLNESKLAKLLGTNNTYLSSIINNRFGLSFSSLLNKYRIDEARKLLISEEYAHFSVDGIASEVGYRSRSAFYQVFKQNTGMTPSEYVKAYKQIDD